MSEYQQLKSEWQRSGGTSREMPRYKCHKSVWALKIKAIHRGEIPMDTDVNEESDGCEGGAMIVPAEDGYAPFHVAAGFLRRHKPQVGGYYVVYQDGYSSYSPQKAFEDGYALEN